MLKSWSNETTGRHRKSRDRGFSLVEVVGAVAGASVLAAAGAGAVSFANGNKQDSGGRDTVAQAGQQVTTGVKDDPAGLDQPAEPEVSEKKPATAPAQIAQPLVAKKKATVAPATCSTRKSAVSLQVDALVHALGAKGGAVRSEAAEADVVARPASGNSCSAVKLFMGEDYAFEAKVPYGKWILDIDVDSESVQVPLAVDRAAVTAPKQLLSGDCGASRTVTVKVRTEDSVLGLNGPVPGATVHAERIVDDECVVPAESNFTVGADGTFTGAIGQGDWMFTVTSPQGWVGDFVTVGKKTDEIVLTRTVDVVDNLRGD